MRVALFFFLAAACGPAVEPCVDADGDGLCASADADDADPSVNGDDADGDGQSSSDGDCDDADPSRNTLDADGDLSTTCDPTPDCDDTDAGLNPHDADADGVSSCDGDCDDDDAARSPATAEVCGDGIDNDCSGREDDLDADGDGDPSLACGGTDCNDRDRRVSGFAVEHCTDGLDNDCSGEADSSDVSACECPDEDGDGYACDDVDDSNPLCGASAVDADADGACVGTDVDDANPHCALASLDADGDGWCVDTDADDTNATCTDHDIDADGDGFCQGVDTDDTNPTCTVSQDSDSDGVCDEVDTEVDNPGCFTSNEDADGDGFCVEADADDTNALCTVSNTDADGDGVCAEHDCDDSEAYGALCSTDCQTWYGDADGDGFLSSLTVHDGCRPDASWQSEVLVEDCADNRRAKSPLDQDGDGVSTCDEDPDCDDQNPAVFPGAVEQCDGLDNDCTGFVDDGFDDADGDGQDDCADVCPDAPPVVPGSITFRYMGYACQISSCGTYDGSELAGVTGGLVPAVALPHLLVNGVDLGALPATNFGCYGQQPSNVPPASFEYTVPAGVWEAGQLNTVSWSELPSGWPSCSSTGQRFAMHGYLQAILHFDDGVPDVPLCLWTAEPNAGCGGPSQNYNYRAANRPPYFFRTNNTTFVGSSGGLYVDPTEVQADVDGDGVPVECDLCPDDPGRASTFSEQCNNGIDDDCDGLTDAADDDCCEGVDTLLAETGACDDGVDNDCDGLVDLDDADCSGVCALPERQLALVAGAEDAALDGTVHTCAASPSDDGCVRSAAENIGWIELPVADPSNAGWTLTVCATDAADVVVDDGSCDEGSCLDRALGCYAVDGTGDDNVVLGLASVAGVCEVPFTAELTPMGGAL